MDYREKIVHGDEGLPIAVYVIEPDHIRYRMNIHWHPELEILYVRKGTLQLRLNEESHCLRAGDVYLIPGGTIHSGEPEQCSYTCVLVNLSLLMKKSDACMAFANRVSDGSVKILTDLGGQSDAFAHLCEGMRDACLRHGDGYAFEIKGLIFSFFGVILNNGLYGPGTPGISQTEAMTVRMKTVLAYIEKNYAAPLRLEELAQQADMTPNHLCKCFKTVTGMTPFAYLIGCRLSKAQYALKTTDLPVTGIALDCGFNDISYFIRLFRKTYGITPKQFRKAAQMLSESEPCVV